MADEGDVLTELPPENPGNSPGNQPLGNGADTGPVAGIVSQYVKDLSVENPRAPESFGWADQPELDVQFNIGAKMVNDEITEVELKISVTAKAQEGTAYIVELAYCGLVGMRNMPDEQKHMFTYAEAPRFLFPFARQVVSEAVRNAGFAPLMLDPIDFNGLYFAQLQQRQAEQGDNFSFAPEDFGQGGAN